MNIQTLFKHTPATFILLVIIVGYYIVLVMMGVSADNPSVIDLLTYGANALPFTLGAEPWRLVISGFLHAGIMHLLFNGFALYYFGQALERIVGLGYFLAVFILAVVGGNLLSLSFTLYNWIYYDPVFIVTAGASGGIMGLGAALLALSYSRHPSAKMLNKRSLLTIMVINLLIGFSIPSIDNAAHIGGALTGILMTAGYARLPQLKWQITIIFGLIYVLWWGFLSWQMGLYLN